MDDKTKKTIIARIKQFFIRTFSSKAYEAAPDAIDDLLENFVDPATELNAIIAPLQQMADNLADFSDREYKRVLVLTGRLEQIKHAESQSILLLTKLQNTLGIKPTPPIKEKDSGADV